MPSVPGGTAPPGTIVRPAKSTKKVERNCKKCLTNGLGGGNIYKLSDESPSESAGGESGGEKPRKKEKKPLDKMRPAC